MHDTIYMKEEDRFTYINNYDNEVKLHEVLEGESDNEKCRKVRDFFTEKFKSSTINKTDIKYLMQNCRKLNRKESKSINTDIKNKDIMQGIKSLKDKCSPGSDGLTSEFYKKFSSDFKHILLWMWNESMKQNCLPLSTRTGLITLLYKMVIPQTSKIGDL